MLTCPALVGSWLAGLLIAGTGGGTVGAPRTGVRRSIGTGMCLSLGFGGVGVVRVLRVVGAARVTGVAHRAGDGVFSLAGAVGASGVVRVGGVLGGGGLAHGRAAGVVGGGGRGAGAFGGGGAVGVDRVGVGGGVGGEGFGVDEDQELGGDFLLQQGDEGIGLAHAQRAVIALRPRLGVGVQQGP
ncbi:hypothetical protein ACIBK1_07450 [Microbispora rosea]|uniref:hypothetical protein n=1 Tax=Microbispora rosea TaxID=58117 RepID=UPI0037BB1AB6